MPPHFRIHFDKLAPIAEELTNMPPSISPQLTKPQAVKVLLPAIKILQRRGYSIGEIATVLSSKGIPLTGERLRTYLYHLRGGPRAKEAPLGPPATSAAALGPILSSILRPPPDYPEEEPMGDHSPASEVGSSRDPLDLIARGISPNCGVQDSRPPARPSRGNRPRS